MSRIRANKITNKAGTGAIELEKGAHLPIGMGITGAGGLNITGDVTVGSGVTIESNGQATFTGIVTFGSSSTTIEGDNNVIKVGTALTLGHTQGVQFHTQNLHSAGFEVNQINASGIITASSLSVSGNVSVGGTLTYEDVTNIDSVGLVTARDGIKMTGGSLYVGGNSNFTGTLTGTASTALSLTVTDESSDTTCFPIFATASTGTIGPKTGSNLSFNSSSGQLTATSFAGSGSGITGIPAANLTGTAAAINGSNITNLTAANLTGALPAISGANLTGIEGGKVRNYKHVVDTGYAASSWSSFTQIASFTYTPLQNDSKIIVIASLNFLWENSNLHNARMRFGLNSYVQYNKTQKAASISGWLSGNVSAIFHLGTSGNTGSNSVILEAQGNGSNTSYFNYSSAHSQFLLLEMAPEG